MIGHAHSRPAHLPDTIVFLVEWALIVLLLVAVEIGGLLVLDLLG